MGDISVYLLYCVYDLLGSIPSQIPDLLGSIPSQIPELLGSIPSQISELLGSDFQFSFVSNSLMLPARCATI